MNRDAFNQAKIRLRRARRAASSLASPTTFDQLEQAWSDFLIAANAVFSKLEIGARASGKAQAWYGRIVHERRTDQLLAYFHHARNSDEHGTEYGLQRDSLNITHYYALPNGKTFAITASLQMGGHDGVDEPTARLANGALTVVAPPTSLAVSKLAGVSNKRFGLNLAVPTEHLGSPIPDPTPAVVADLMLIYLDRLVREAEDFLTK